MSTGPEQPNARDDTAPDTAPDTVPDAVDGPGLNEATRQRLVTIAADVLGRMAPDQVPASLRSVAKFTPAKRARLAGPQLAATLDNDADFRAKVAEVVEQASPQLVEAVRSGGSTAASDPIDTALVAYLIRPDGWQDVIDVANGRWAVDRTGTAADGDEIAKLRDELVEARARLKAETARAKEAVAAAGAELAEQLADARRQLRQRTGDLRAAERARDEATALAAELQRRLENAESARDAEQRRARTRIGELERAVESLKRGARADRDIDDARLWLLVDTLTEAAAGVRRELSLAPPSVRPGDRIASAGTSGAARRADDPAGLDRLLALPNVHVIIDGYNVTKTGYPDLSLADQRSRLIIAMAALGARASVEITIVFDGGKKPPAQPPTPRGVRVLFSAPDEIADDLIRRLVRAEPEGRPIVVITADQQVITDVTRAGAWCVPSAVLLARLG